VREAVSAATARARGANVDATGCDPQGRAAHAGPGPLMAARAGSARGWQRGGDVGEWDGSGSIREVDDVGRLVSSFAPEAWKEENAEDGNLGLDAPAPAARGLRVAAGKVPRRPQHRLRLGWVFGPRWPLRLVVRFVGRTVVDQSRRGGWRRRIGVWSVLKKPGPTRMTGLLKRWRSVRILAGALRLTSTHQSPPARRSASSGPSQR
jgi:hypothetical protein